MSSELEGVHVIATCTCTASYGAMSSDKSMKSASVQEANITPRSSAHRGQEPVDQYEFC